MLAANLFLWDMMWGRLDVPAFQEGWQIDEGHLDRAFLLLGIFSKIRTSRRIDRFTYSRSGVSEITIRYTSLIYRQTVASVLMCPHLHLYICECMCTDPRIAMCKGSVDDADLPPQVSFSDVNVPDLPALPRGYTHTDFLRRFVLRGKYEDETRTSLLVQITDGQKLYQPRHKKATRCIMPSVYCFFVVSNRTQQQCMMHTLSGTCTSSLSHRRMVW